MAGVGAAFLIGLFIWIVVAKNWDTIVGLVVFILVVIVAVLAGIGIHHFIPWWREQKLKQLQEQEHQRQLEAEQLADLQPLPAYPTEAEFKRTLLEAYRERSEVLVSPLLDPLISAFGKFYTNDFRPPEKLPSHQDGMAPYRELFSACLKSLNDFTDSVPHLREPRDFKLPELNREEVVSLETLHFLPLTKPLQNLPHFPQLSKWNYLRGDRPPQAPSYPDKQEKREYEREMKEWERFSKRMLEATPAFQINFTSTPLWNYYRDIPLILELRKPFQPPKSRFEGAWMVAPSGSGKTNALLKLITDDFEAVAQGNATVIVMDSSGMAPGRLLHYLSRHKDFAPGGRLENRLVVLEPSIEFPLALNLFDVGQERIRNLPLDEKVIATTSARSMVEYVLGGLLGSEMTSKQTGTFGYLVEALLQIPDATIFTLAELLENDGYEKHRHHILKLDPWARDFFEKRFRQQYNSRNQALKNAFAGTKEEIFWRILKTLKDPAFRAMFAHPKNKLDMFSEMHAGKVIIISTHKTLMGEEGASTFGRMMLAQIYQAAERRLDIASKENLPVFVYLDECHDYIANEPKIIKLLDQLARKNNIGFFFAHQRTDNLSPAVLDAVSSVAIRYASRNEHGVNYIAERLRAEPEVITQLPQGTFTNLIREPQGSRTAIVHFPLVDEKLTLMTEPEYANIQTVMHQRYCEAPMEVPELKEPVYISPLEPVDEDEV